MRVIRLDKPATGWQDEQQLIDAGGTKVTLNDIWRRMTAAGEQILGVRREMIGMRFSNAAKGYVLWECRFNSNGGANGTWNFGVMENSVMTQAPVWQAVNANVDRTELPQFSTFNSNLIATHGADIFVGSTVQAAQNAVVHSFSLAGDVDLTTGMNFVGGTGDEYQIWYNMSIAQWLQDITVCLYEFDL